MKPSVVKTVSEKQLKQPDQTTVRARGNSLLSSLQYLKTPPGGTAASMQFTHSMRKREIYFMHVILPEIQRKNNCKLNMFNEWAHERF